MIRTGEEHRLTFPLANLAAVHRSLDREGPLRHVQKATARSERVLAAPSDAVRA